MRILKIVAIVLFAVYAIGKAFRPDECNLLNGANLLFHEAGHPIFGIFGQSIGIWGGTIMQLLVPAVFVGHFIYHRQMYSACFVMCWFGQNFFHISHYLQDARAQELPLVGGGEHDWNRILYSLGLLQWDREIGGALWFLGFVIIVVFALLGIFYSVKPQNRESAVSSS